MEQDFFSIPAIVISQKSCRKFGQMGDMLGNWKLGYEKISAGCLKLYVGAIAMDSKFFLTAGLSSERLVG
jgi:hypothetical protein